MHAADHDRMLEATGAARRRAETLCAVADALTGAQPDPGTHAVAFAAVRDLARRLLDSGPSTPEVPRAGTVTAWWCTTCGRVEAPQPCLGVCIHQPGELVAAREHRRAAAALDAARRDELRAERLARLVAGVTPRDGQAARTWAALRGQALAVR